MLPFINLPAFDASVLTLAQGFNPFEFAGGATFWTWVSFLLALPLMWKFVFGPITSALEERDNKVEEAIVAAEAARAEAQAQTEATRAELEKARAEARQMVHEATARAERQAAEALAQAKAEADRQVQKAAQEIEAQKQKALLEIRAEVVGMAISSAGRILKQEVDAEANQRLVNEFLQSPGGVNN